MRFVPRPPRWIAALVASVGATASAPALTIQLDYSLDTNGFFGAGFGGTTARAAVDAAAADLSAAITTSLTAVNQNSFTAGVGSTATLSTTNRYIHPATGVDLSRDVTTNPVAADTVVIYVGSRALTGSTLGQGGNAAQLGGGWSGNPSAATVASVGTMFQDHQGRGGGPIISSLSTTLNGTPVTANAGSIVGHLWFDHDTNDDTLLNSLDLDEWHIDHTTPVASGKDDLYSVALHEIMHVIGIGVSTSWSSLASGTTWTGANAIAQNGGSGIGLLASDSAHIASSITSTRISDGGSQVPAMSPSITEGTRKTLTHMDIAFLQDIGWNVIPEPSSTSLLLGGGLLVVLRRRARRA